MKLAVFDQNGKKATKTVEVSDKVFGSPVNTDLLSQYVYVYLSNQRATIAHTKGRGAVSGGGRKPWAQKGTGRARHGSTRSPIWRKGGVAWGPTSDRNWKKTITKKMRSMAIVSALSKLVKEDKLKVVDQIQIQPEKMAKQGIELLKAFGEPRKVTIVAGEKDLNLINAFNNISNSKVILVSELNAYELVNAGEVIFLENALAYTEHWN
jgi:large subunit ribosomal protein L4